MGYRIKEVREEKRMTQEELAAKTARLNELNALPNPDKKEK